MSSRSRPFQNAFSSGELDPLLYARSDFTRFQTGLAACRGFVPLRQGGFTRAPGTIYRGSTKGDKIFRRVPFVFAANDALTLEFTDLVMRVWRYGVLIEASPGVPYELVTPFGETQLSDLQWVQDKDVVYITDGQRPIQKLSRFALDNWTIADLELNAGPFRVQNLDEAVTVRCSAATGTITLTGVGGPFALDHVGSLLRLEPTDFSNIPQWVGNATAAVNDRFVSDAKIYQLTAGNNTGVNPPLHISGTQRTDASKPTAFRYISDLVGIVRITAFTDANTATAEVLKSIPQPCIDDPTFRWSEGAWSARFGYPACLEMSDQRLWGARTPTEPRAIWASTLGAFTDFAPSIEADGSFAYSISGSQTNNSVLWLRRGRKGNYIGALGEVYRGFSAVSGQAIGPTTFTTELVSQDGASSALPISAYGYPIFITRDGRRLQELRYTFEEDGARAVELSLPSQHLGALKFLQAIWQSVPQRIAWMRVATGDLVLMIYDPAQDVLGWAIVPVAGGVVEDMDVTPGADGSSDVLTLVVQRSVNGQTKRFVEEQAVTFGVLNGTQGIEEAVHFFASSVFEPGSPTNSFSVPHLEGEEVHVWTDVGEHGPLTVGAGGAITSPVEVNRATIGLLDQTHYAETLDIGANAPDGSSRGRPRRLHGPLGVDLHRTAAGYVQGIAREIGQPDYVGPSHELIPLAIAQDLSVAFSGTSRIDMDGAYAEAVRLRFTPFGGAPMTVLAITPTIEEAGA